MLLRQHLRVLPVTGLLVFIFLAVLAFRLSNTTLVLLPPLRGAPAAELAVSIDEAGATEQTDETGKIAPPGAVYIERAYNEISSVSTPDKKYFPIHFGEWEAINPNAIPHPSREDTWIIAAQKQRSDVKDSVFFSELVCNAKFKDGALVCVDSPLLLPTGTTPVSMSLFYQPFC